MINAETERLCKEIRAELDCTKTPIDLDAVMAKEKITAAPGDYGRDFHGRIEFVPSVKAFFLYYPDETCNISVGRIRFSIAHELGHYYLPEHRQGLLAEGSYDCAVGFVSDKDKEREADEFAAAFLIPDNALKNRMGLKCLMNLASIISMADDLAVSVPAAVIRCVHYAEEKCAVVLSEAGRVKYCISSDAMKEIGFSGIKKGAEIPSTSKAMSLQAAGTYRQCDGALSSTADWFYSRGTNLDLWEDSFALGYSDQVITLLSVQRREYR